MGIFYFSSKTDYQNSRKLKRNQDLNVLYMYQVFFCFFFGGGGAIRIPRWLSCRLICRDIFYFYLQQLNRIELNFTDLNALYQVCVSRAYRKTKMTVLASDWLIHFWLLLCNRWLTESNKSLQDTTYLLNVLLILKLDKILLETPNTSSLSQLRSPIGNA